MNKTVLISLPIDELQTVIIDCVNACLRNDKRADIKQPETAEFITRQDVADIYGVTLPTVHAWINAGILTPYKIANKTRFKRAEVMAAAKTTKNESKGGQSC